MSCSVIQSKYDPDTEGSTKLRNSAMITFGELKKLARLEDFPNLNFDLRVLVLHRFHPNATHEESTSSAIAASFSILCPKTATRSYGRMWRTYGQDMNPLSPLITPISCVRKENLVKVKIQWRIPECLVASEGHFVVLHWPNIGKGHLVCQYKRIVPYNA